jgi:hypothetical protein
VTKATAMTMRANRSPDHQIRTTQLKVPLAIKPSPALDLQAKHQQIANSGIKTGESIMFFRTKTRTSISTV